MAAVRPARALRPSRAGAVGAGAAAVLSLSLLLSACGGTAADETRRLATAASVIAHPRPVPVDVVTTAQIRRAPRGSVERALLEHWAALQAGDVPGAARDFEPGLRGFVGARLLAGALGRQAGVCRAARPRIRATHVPGAPARIPAPPVGPRPGAATFTAWARDRRGRWLITHDVALDAALDDAARHDTQLAVAPLSQQPTAAAQRAGRAAGTLQRRYNAAR